MIFHESGATLPAATTNNLSYFLGLDLGQAQDYTALCILERHGASRGNYTFHCRHLQRWLLRTPYPTIVTDALNRANDRRMFPNGKRPVLAVDATGVGAPVIDLFKRARMQAKLEPVQIVAGSTITRENGLNRIPKRDLASIVQVHLQNERLKIAAELSDASSLVRELQNFQVKITDAGNDTYGAWREGAHDDLVLAVALALWAGTSERSGVFYSE